MESNFIFNGPIGPIQCLADIDLAIEIRSCSSVMFPIALFRNVEIKKDFLIIDDSFENSILLVKEYESFSENIHNLLSGEIGFTRPIARRNNEKILHVDFIQESGIIKSSYCEKFIKNELEKALLPNDIVLKWEGFNYRQTKKSQ